MAMVGWVGAGIEVVDGVCVVSHGYGGLGQG